MANSEFRFGATLQKCFALFLAGYLGSSASHASIAETPKGKFSVNFDRVEYDPSKACYRPDPPILPAFNSKLENEVVISIYHESVEEYMNCLKHTSEADIAYIRKVVQEGCDQAEKELIREVRSKH